MTDAEEVSDVRALLKRERERTEKMEKAIRLAIATLADHPAVTDTIWLPDAENLTLTEALELALAEG